MSSTSATESMLLAKRGDGRLRLTLNRPAKLNALHPDQLRELTAIILAAGDDDAITGIAIDGAGTDAFSAGFDIDALAAAGGGSSAASKPLFETVAALRACPKPTVALVRGHCIGAGFDLAMSCDVRVGAGAPRFAVPAVRLGTVYEPRSIDHIQRLLGPLVAKELFVFGRTIGAERALAVGILQELVPLEDADTALARWLPDGGEAIAAHKRVIDVLATDPARADSFWGPLDELRARSVRSRARQEAVQGFRSGRGAGKEC